MSLRKIDKATFPVGYKFFMTGFLLILPFSILYILTKILPPWADSDKNISIDAEQLPNTDGLQAVDAT